MLTNRNIQMSVAIQSFENSPFSAPGAVLFNVNPRSGARSPTGTIVMRTDL